MPRRPHPLPEMLGECFTVAEGARAGLTSRRMRARDLEAPFRGARIRAVKGSTTDVPADPVAFAAEVLQRHILRRAEAFAKVATARMFFSHVTAAVIWRLPLPLSALIDTHATVASVIAAAQRGDIAGITARAAPLDVAVLAPHRASKARGVRSRRLSGRLTAVRTEHGLRVASPASTWAQLATVLDVDRLVEVGDAIVFIPRRRGLQRGRDADALATLGHLAAVVDAGPRAAIACLRNALPLIRVGSASPPETRLRLACARSGLPEPDLDVDVVPGSTDPIGYTELAYLEFGILIEHEGDHHRTDPEQWNRDIAKYAACQAAGWTVLRITKEHMRNGARVAVEQIREALLRAGWHPGR